MDELFEKVRSVCAGLTEAEIKAQIQASQWAEYIGDPDTLASFLCAVAQAGQDATQVQPAQDESEEDEGNDS